MNKELKIKKLKQIKKIQNDFWKDNLNLIKLRVGSMIGFRLIFHPIDRLRLIKQTSYITNQNNYKSNIYEILKNQNGIKGLYKVNTLWCSMGLITTSLKILMVNTMSVAFLKKGDKFYSNCENYFRKTLGCITSNLLISIFTYPFERIKLISTIDTKCNKKLINYFKEIIVKDGISGLYKGILIDNIVKFPEFYLMFLLHNNLSNKKDNIHKIYFEYFLSSLLIYPIKTLKKIYQVDSLVLNDKYFYSKSLNEFVKTIYNQGYIRLYNGFSLYLFYTGLLILFQKELIKNN